MKATYDLHLWPILTQQRQEIVGTIYMLAFNNTLTLLGSKNCFLQKRIKGNDGVRLKYTSWPINHYSGMSAVGDFYSHPEIDEMQQT